ncbi:uracil-DNA glycosylase family protein [Oceanobacillus bengalensis]|uniref:Uracil-DNA glycosylase-like domain-containing protein n=1 Tax=Oceanobacillus bengalensis TaxID=1435466 RepID=A0A494Z7T3_9BACI|nr:uracil-DNA glycosylase family protein [Oceanobacillus bengalensis]RKQ18576.1 hypothetical protein D8M05_00220 [Oceanobacillus bengalensis]
MSIASYSKFNQFKQSIQSLSSISEEIIKSEQFLLEKDEKKQLEIYYAPFEYINDLAKVVIVGITPGLNQMKQSYSTVFHAKNADYNDEKLLSQVKNKSSFEGAMRKNLIQMLDEIGLHEHLNISSTANFFDEASELVHTTSVITYPVFHKGANYSGSTPNMLKTKILKNYILNQFVTELNEMNNPLIIPLGKKVSNVFDYLVENELLDSKYILSGFPHPSGANGSRKKQFEANKEKMIEILRTHFHRVISY